MIIIIYQDHLPCFPSKSNLNLLTKMSDFTFTKMSGAGNDFIVIDKNKNINFRVENNLVSRMCDRRNGVGADGLITVEDSSSYDFIMNYYNADGSTGSLCANGARCAILFALKSGRLEENRAEFVSNNIVYNGSVISDSQIKFFLNPPQKIKNNFKIKAGGKILNSHFVDTGSPHVIIDIQESEGFLNSLDEIPVELLGREIRYLSEFSPMGTNVNFIEILNGTVYIRTYERGVEAETLACGTGSVAAALLAYINKKISVPIEIIPKSKEKLFVNFDIENSEFKNLSLTGPAKIVFTGEMKL